MVYFADIQSDPEKRRNRQILVVSLSVLCYYWTESEMFELLTIKYGTVLNFWRFVLNRQFLKSVNAKKSVLLVTGASLACRG